MFEVTRLIRFADGADDTARHAVLDGVRAAVAPTAVAALAEPVLPGGIGGTDAVARIRFADETGWQAIEAGVSDALGSAAVAHVDGVVHTGRVCPSRGGTPTIFRTLLVAVDPAADPELVRRFESETAAMPHYIPSIGPAQCAPAGDPVGDARWTHVWEQEYATLDGLTGPYMTHPYHWAHVDRWFDPERGQRIVTALRHSFVTVGASLLTAGCPTISA
ncbi:Dabb family protein [Prescottella sp. R16]|uniref:Dabb family protein n=1 Tax=Prescottella sp. R16 TaxID=3064529 RepID=UPI00272DEA90|nr:Dabb family protein [Prescottella sp. R16]